MINIFSITLPLYGVFFYMGIIFSVFVALLLRKKNSIPVFDLIAGGTYAMIGAMVGAKFLFILVSLKEIINLFKLYPFEDALFSIIKGGFVFYGGLLGGILGLFIYTKQFKLPFSQFTDIFATILPLGHAFGRVGCFFAGCCYGVEYHGPLGYTYVETFGNTPLGIPLLPVQLIEASILILLFLILLWVFLKCKKQPYLVTKIYITGYACIRFILEFFRGDKERGDLLGISTSQWISILMIVCIIIITVTKQKNRRLTNL